MRAFKPLTTRGENLLDENHAEVSEVAIRREVRRSVFGTARWTS